MKNIVRNLRKQRELTQEQLGEIMVYRGKQ